MELKKILQENDFEFKKKFGQNFISDENLLKAICADAELTEQDNVLEIGVGAGTLTRQMASVAKKVVGFEIDKTLKEILDVSLANASNASIVFGDFLDAKSEEVNSYFNGSFKVVANLPYYVTTNIILKLINENFNLTSLTLMVQKEVAERLVAKSGTKDYGTLTAELDSIADVSIKRIVGKQMFNPVPKVDSAVVHIKINRKKYEIENYNLHQKVIRSAFAMRRKTLHNCLKSNFSFDDETMQKLFETLNLSKTVRGESLTTEQFVNLSNYINRLKK